MKIFQSMQSENTKATKTPANRLAAAGRLGVMASLLTLGLAAHGQTASPSLACQGELPEPVAMSLVAGKSTLLKLPAPIVRRTLGSEGVVQVRQLGPQTLYLLGAKVGSTNMILQDRAGKCALIDIDVGADPGGLKAKLAKLMPGEKGIDVTSAADSLLLTGVVSDAYKAERAVAIASAYAGGDQSAQKVINMLNVAAPQQVMLEVQVAEISKTLLDKMGGSWSFLRSGSNWAYGLLNDPGNLLGGGSLPAGSSNVLGALKNNGKAGLALEAEKKDGLVKILAEPNIMAISGQEGAFLAGGKIFIPVPSYGAGGVSNVTLEEREFGVGLKFTPTVLEGGLINLRVAPEVSELASEGVTLGSGGGTSVLPLITTRRAATTIQLYDGQSFAIGGLIKNNVTQNISAFPVLGEIPVLGALFRSSAFQSDKSELLIVVTPHLVKPLPQNYKLPTDSFVEPSRTEFFLGGKMEGSSPEGNASAASPSGFEVK